MSGKPDSSITANNFLIGLGLLVVVATVLKGCQNSTESTSQSKNTKSQSSPTAKPGQSSPKVTPSLNDAMGLLPGFGSKQLESKRAEIPTEYEID